MATTVTTPSANASNRQPAGTGRTDGYLAKLLLLFFLAVYLLTGGGHGYSPDGEFAFNVARSATLDPKHEYLKKMQKGLSQWGVMVPVLSQPLVLVGGILAPSMPNKDYAIVDGNTFVLGRFKGKDALRDAPTVGSERDGGDRSYTLSNIKDGSGRSLAMISFLSLSTAVAQGTTVAELTAVGTDGTTATFPIRAGIETAEWSIPKYSDITKHQMAPVASVWMGNTGGRNYYAELPFGQNMELKEIRIHYLVQEGQFFVRAFGLVDREAGTFQKITNTDRIWSERENEDLFARLFYAPYNAIITAIGCILLFALIRLFGYSQIVAMATTLLYGLATLAWPYSKYDFSEPTLVVMLLSTLYLIYRWGQNHRDRLLLLAGVCALGCVATKYASGVLVPFMALQIGLLHWEQYPSAKKLTGAIKPLLLFALPFIVVAGPAVWYFGSRFGYYPSILEAWAGVQRGWLPLPFDIGLRGLLFSPGKSFFLFSPPMILALVGLLPFVKRHGLKSIGLLAIAIIYFTIYSKKVAWHAGSGWGPRYQVLVIPLFMLAIAPLVQKAIEERHRLLRAALLATLVLGIGLQVLAISKSFDRYLGLFRTEIVQKLPDKGAQYGGGDYFPYSEGLDDHNSVTATMYSLPFSPIFAQMWLLGGDALALGPAAVQPYKERLLATPPWKLIWGIDVLPEHPEHGLGLDFWSMQLWTDFYSYTTLRVVVMTILLLLEAIIIVSGARIAGYLLSDSSRRRRFVRAWLVLSITCLLLFDGIHFIL